LTVLDFSSGFSDPFYQGAGIAADSGVVYPISLGDFSYMLDSARANQWTHSSIPLLRGQADIANNVGQQTLNPEAFWRRTFESWHVGAGQTHFDREDTSNPWRFRRSKGVNVWDRYQISLLNDVDAKGFGTETNPFLAVAGGFLYLAAGDQITYTTDITPGSPSFTSITGEPATDVTGMASDGFNVLTAHGTNGVYKTTRGAATTASNITGTVTHVFYGKGRWIAAQDNNLYDVTTLVAGGGALPAALFSHSNTDFDWNCFAEGPTALYAAGFSGDKSLIYRLTMKEDGTGLNQPVVAGFLPDGELVTSMYGYLGFVLIGTSKGVRIGIVGGNADLTIGALIPTDEEVLCFEGQDKYVWFGWGTFEGTSVSGLGRIDLETFSNTESLAPAYASDLMASGAGNTFSVVTFQDRRVFAVVAGGVYVLHAEEPDILVATGEIDSGLFDYGLTDEKVSLYVDMSHVSDGGSHSVYLSVDRGGFAHLATMEDEHHPIPTGEARANEFEIRVSLTRDGSDTSMGPVIRSWRLRSQPAAPITPEIVAPLLISPRTVQTKGFVEGADTLGQVANIEELCANKTVTVYREGLRAWSVIVADYQLDMKELYFNADEALGVNATCMVRMKVVVSA